MTGSSGRQFNFINLLMIICMSFGSISYGYSASIISTTLAQPTFLTYFDLDTRSDATSLISTMNGLYQVGGFLGVFTVSYFADHWGRRVAIGVSALITVLSGALLAGSVNVAMVCSRLNQLDDEGIWLNAIVHRLPFLLRSGCFHAAQRRSDLDERSCAAAQ